MRTRVADLTGSPARTFLEWATDHHAQFQSALECAEALRRALFILIDTAAKYTPEGGSVRSKLSANDGFARFSVSDTKIGIAPADLPHSFDRSWRADKARSGS